MNHKAKDSSADAKRAVPVIVVVTDTSFPVEYRATGVLLPSGDLLAHYPFRAQGDGNDVALNVDSGAFDLSHLILADGSELSHGDGGWQEIAELPVDTAVEAIDGVTAHQAEFDLVSVNGTRYVWNATFNAYIAIDGVPRPLLQADMPAGD